MGLIVDLIIVAIVVLSTFLAYRKGLIMLAIQLLAVMISIVITVVLYKPISNLVINVTSIDETIENAILEKANDIMTDKQEKSAQIVETIQNNMLPETARTIAINIVQGLVIFLLFIIARIILKFVSGLANLVSKLPILNQFNRLGGSIYGLLRGIILIYILLLVVNLSGKINPQNTVYVAVEGSYIGKVMNEHNVLNVFFDSVEQTNR